MKTAKQDPWTEYLACAECDTEDPIGKTRGGEDPLFICPACGTVEGATRTLWANDETEEVTDVMPGPAAPPVSRPEPGTPEYEAAVVELRAVITGRSK